MYYLITCTLSLMSKLHGSESNSVAIFQLNSPPGRIFFSFRGFFLEIGKKGGYFGLGMGPIFGPW